jgi:hypothetical protein
MEDVEYFRKKLYKSLSVPISRLESDGQFSLGRGSEISRDEIKFAKFIERLRDRFSHLFDHLLEIQLLLTGVMTREEWKEMKNDISYSYQRDNYYAEIKEQDMLNNRLSVLGVVDAYVGKYYSTEWVRKNVLRQSEEDMREIDAQIAAEPDTAQDEMAAQQQQHDQEMQQTQQQMAMKDMDIKAKELEAKAAALKKPEAKPAAAAKPKAQKIEIKLTGDKKGTVKKEEFTPKPLSEEDRRLIENMTRAIEKVSKEDIEEVEEIRDDL